MTGVTPGGPFVSASGDALRALLDSIGTPLYIAEVRPSGEIAFLAANRRWEQFTGFRAAELVGRQARDIGPPSEAEQLEAHLRRCVASREPVQYELSFPVPAGRRWWRATVSPILDDHGRVVRLLAATADVTAERGMQENLRFQTTLLRTQQELMPDGVLVADVLGNILSWNRRFQEMWGLDPGLLQQGRSAAFPLVLSQLQDPERFHERVERLYEALEESVEREELQLKDGRVFLWNSRGLFEQDGVVQGRIWYFRDISEERRAQDLLSYQHALLTVQQDLMPDGVLVADVHGNYLAWNRRLKEMWGVDDDVLRQGRQAFTPRVLAQLVDPDLYQTRREQLYSQLEASIEGEPMPLLDGRTVVVYSRGLVDTANIKRGRIWYFRDITEIQEAERELREAHAFREAILNSASQMIIAADRDGRIRMVNRATEVLLGYSEAELLGRLAPEVLHDPDELARRQTELRETLGRPVDVLELFQARPLQGETTVQDWHYVRKDGQRIPVELRITRVVDETGEVTGVLRTATDISERKAFEERLRHLASTDALTRLPNRRHFLELSEQALRRAQRDHEPLAVALLDVDYFKKVNDTHGHAAGDAVLQTVARTLAMNLRESNLLCRWGGEEFAVALINTAPEGAQIVTERLRQKVAALEIMHEGQLIRVTISIGVSDWRAGENGLGPSMQRADAALYEAKAAGRNCVRFAWSTFSAGNAPNKG